MALSDFIANARDPLYGAGRYQRKPNFDYTQTPVIGGPSGFLEQNPDAVWTRYLSGRLGVNPTDTSAFGRWMQQQEQGARQGFLAAQAEDPTLLFQNYLNGIRAQDFVTRFRQLTPQDRGENWSRFAGASRWLSDL